MIVEDAANGELKEIYQPEIDAKGNDIKPSFAALSAYSLGNFGFGTIQPRAEIFADDTMSKLGAGWGKFFVVPIETGRGCPYGCEFCTVTGFFGDSIRFRTNESVVEELLRLKKRAKERKRTNRRFLY